MSSLFDSISCSSLSATTVNYSINISQYIILVASILSVFLLSISKFIVNFASNIDHKYHFIIQHFLVYITHVTTVKLMLYVEFILAQRVS